MENVKREGLHVAIIMDGNSRWAARQECPAATVIARGVAAVRRRRIDNTL
jgi:undecaprenyl diphosphate synthase